MRRVLIRCDFQQLLAALDLLPRNNMIEPIVCSFKQLRRHLQRKINSIKTQQNDFYRLHYWCWVNTQLSRKQMHIRTSPNNKIPTFGYETVQPILKKYNSVQINISVRISSLKIGNSLKVCVFSQLYTTCHIYTTYTVAALSEPFKSRPKNAIKDVSLLPSG